MMTVCNFDIRSAENFCKRLDEVGQLLLDNLCKDEKSMPQPFPKNVIIETQKPTDAKNEKCTPRVVKSRKRVTI